jgi:hypothetical protein
MKDFSNECGLLFSLMRIKQPLTGKSSGLDWGFLLKTLLDNGLCGLAWWRFRESEEPVPDKIEKILYQHYLVNQFTNILLLEEAERIFLTFKKAGIEVIPLKGIALLEHVYPLGARQLSDIDLLVDPTDAVSALKVFKEMGFIATDLFDFRKYHISLYKQKGTQFLPVDISWNFIRRWQDQSLPSISHLKERCMIKRIAKVNVRWLCLVDQINYIAGHVALHHDLNFPKGLTDICALLDCSAETDWHELEKSSREYGLLGAVIVIMGILNTRLGLPVGGNFPAQWQKMRSGMLRGLDGYFLENQWLCGAVAYSELKERHGGIKKNLAIFMLKQRLKDSLSQKVWGVITVAFPTAERIRKMYNPTNALMAFLCRVIHLPLFLIFSPIVIVFIYGFGLVYATGMRHKLKLYGSC